MDAEAPVLAGTCGSLRTIRRLIAAGGLAFEHGERLQRGTGGAIR